MLTMALAFLSLAAHFKTDAPFAEFQWANFFRSRIPEPALANLTAAEALAFKLAASPEASALPGFTRTPLSPVQDD